MIPPVSESESTILRDEIGDPTLDARQLGIPQDREGLEHRPLAPNCIRPGSKGIPQDDQIRRKALGSCIQEFLNDANVAFQFGQTSGIHLTAIDFRQRATEGRIFRRMNRRGEEQQGEEEGSPDGSSQHRYPSQFPAPFTEIRFETEAPSGIIQRAYIIGRLARSKGSSARPIRWARSVSVASVSLWPYMITNCRPRIPSRA